MVCTANVTMKGEIPTIAEKKPLTSPTPTAMDRTATMATHMLIRGSNEATSTPLQVATAAIERSKSPKIKQTVSPVEMMPRSAICLKIVIRFPTEGKIPGRRIEKIVNSKSKTAMIPYRLKIGFIRLIISLDIAIRFRRLNVKPLLQP